jgi:hypothetical protein
MKSLIENLSSLIKGMMIIGSGNTMMQIHDVGLCGTPCLSHVFAERRRGSRLTISYPTILVTRHGVCEYKLGKRRNPTVKL